MAIVHDFELDVRGETSPYPLLRTKQQSGNELLSVEVNGNTYTIFVRKG